MTTTPLFDLIELRGNAESTRFDGATYDPAADHERLSGQLARVIELMRDGAWRTLAEIVADVGGSEGGVGARLRDLRKRKYGSHTVERRRRGDPKAGLHEYRLLLNGR